MGNSISIFFLIEAVGTIAFASSGAMVAIRQNLDLLGIIVLGVTTAVGGGMMRDILLGIVPPSLFTNPIYTIMAFITVMVLFIVIRMNQHFLEGDCIVTYEKLMNIFDAIGLAAFTVTGIDTAVMAGYGDYHFLSVFLGVLTGCSRSKFLSKLLKTFDKTFREIFPVFISTKRREKPSAFFDNNFVNNAYFSEAASSSSSHLASSSSKAPISSRMTCLCLWSS